MPLRFRLARCPARTTRRVLLRAGLTGGLAVGLLGGCTTDPVTPTRPSAAAPQGPVRDVSVPYPTGPVPFTTEDGTTYWVDPAASTLTGPTGGFVVLAPDALDYFVSAWQRMQAGEQAGAEVAQESSARRARQPTAPRPPSCRIGVSGRCTADGDPLSRPVPRQPLGAGWGGTQDAGNVSIQAVNFDAISDWNCRDIALAMRDEMVGYREAKKQYITAIATLTGAVLKNGADINPSPEPGKPYWPEPQTLGKLFWYYSLSASAGTLEFATADFEAARTRVGFLGTLYNAQDCLHRDWDPPVEQSPASSSGGGGGTGHPGGGSVCYYEVQRNMEGVTLRSTLLYCMPL